MKDGIINIYKPKGLTSNDCIYKMRSILGIKKLGHVGTLDPMAEGVLPILINKGTRILEYMDSNFKTYEVGMILGVKTTTDDVSGDIITLYDKDIVLPDKVPEIEDFKGLIDQIPPMYSAVRIEGRKLYSYMYDGDNLEIDKVKSKVKPRQVYIEDIKVNSIRYIDKSQINDCDFLDKLSEKIPYISFSITCSKGTYVRSICRDLGEKLGFYGTMVSLVRTKVGKFDISTAISLDKLIDIAEGEHFLERVDRYKVNRLGRYQDIIPKVFEKYIYNLDYPLDLFGKVVTNREMSLKFLDGWHLGYNEVKIIKEPTYINLVDKEELRNYNTEGSYPGLKVHPEYLKAYNVYDESGIFLGVCIHNNRYHKLVADKVFLRREDL